MVDCINYPASPVPASSTFAPTASGGGYIGFVEAVRVRVFLTDPDLSQVAITLKNNATGINSTLMVPGTGLSAQAVGAAADASLDFLTNAFYGEPTTSAGFTLTVIDESLSGSTATRELNSWKIRVIGH